MKALVTGGTGFVGANLVAGLNERGIAVRVLHRPSSSHLALTGLEYESVSGDVLGEARTLAAAMEGCDWVFHVAAVADYWRQGSKWLYKVNVEGTENAAAAAQQAGVARFVFTSSLAAMGLPAGNAPLTEDDSFNVRPEQFPYGHSKLLAEQKVLEAAAAGLEAVIVNPAIVLGPRDVNQISGSMIVEAARGLLRFIPPGGANFVDVADVVAGHIGAAERGSVGERYILGGHNLPYRVVVPILCDVVGCRPPILTLPRWSLPPAALAVRGARAIFGNRIPFDEIQVKMMGAFIYADSSKAERELNLPKTPLKKTVQRAYNWYNENGFL